MSTQLSTTPNGPRAISPLGTTIVEGLEDFGARDFTIPRYAIVQPTSRMEGAEQHAGEFVRNIDHAFTTELRVVLLKISPTRLLWSGDRSDNRPECFSRDCVSGSAYGACNTCSFNLDYNRALATELATARKEKREATLKVCSYGYNLVVADPTTGNLAFLGAMGTSVRPIKDYATRFQIEHRPTFSCVTTIKLARVVSERGKYYVLAPIAGLPFDEGELLTWREHYRGLQGTTLRDVEEEVEVESAF